MMRKMDAYKLNTEKNVYEYKWSTRAFKTCKAFKEYLKGKYPNDIYKVYFAK